MDNNKCKSTNQKMYLRLYGKRHPYDIFLPTNTHPSRPLTNHRFLYKKEFYTRQFDEAYCLLRHVYNKVISLNDTSTSVSLRKPSPNYHKNRYYPSPFYFQEAMNIIVFYRIFVKMDKFPVFPYFRKM